MTVLTLALILGSISVASAVSGKVKLSDIAGNANEEAIQVAYDLEIVQGTPEGAYEPEKPVNRAEFAALIVRALAVPDSALESYKSTIFKDTSGYTWAVPYLAILQQRGIMKGDGYGNAMPGRTITPNEAVTMVLRTVGYMDNASVLVGQWPANYVSLGQNQGLYNNVANDLQMNKASAAQMIYNTLITQLVQVDANSTVNYLWANPVGGTQVERNLLNTNLGCEADPASIVTFGDVPNSNINLIPRIGAYATLYWKGDKIVAIDDIETEFLVGKFSYTADGKLDKFSTVDGKAYTLSGDTKNDVSFIVGDADNAVNLKELFRNGDTAGITSNSAIKGYVTNFYQNVATNKLNQSKLIIAAKVSGATIQRLRSVAVWDADYRGDTFLYTQGQVSGNKFNGHNLPLDVNNEVDHYAYALEGADSIEDIKANNVVYLFKNNDNTIKRIEVGTETQSGVITNINSILEFRTIGGKVLVDAPYHHFTWGDLQLNNEGTALLDFYGRTYAFQLGEASKGNFAVYLASQLNFNSVQGKIFDKTGKEVIYGVRNVFKLYGSNQQYHDTNSIDPNTGNPSSAVPGADTLIEYKLSGNNIATIRNAIPSGTSSQLGHTYAKVNSAGTIITFYDIVNDSITVGTSLLDGNALVYVRSRDNKGNIVGYTVGSVKDLLNKEIANPFSYIYGTDLQTDGLTYKTNNTVKAMIVEEKDAGAQNVYLAVNGLSAGSDGSGGQIDVINGLSFADGPGAEAKNFDYIDSNFSGSIFNPFANNMIFKFNIGEDGVLKNGTALDVASRSYSKGNPTITGAALQNGTYPFWKYGSGGTFTIETNSHRTVDNVGKETYNGGTTQLFAFEANAVLYKKEGFVWVAYAPTEGNFNADKDQYGNFQYATGNPVRYAFLKTDQDKGYDIIIRLP
jgi:hypothetical protein